MVQRVWSGAVQAAAIGKTAGTFDTIGTVTIKKGAKHILGFMVSIASSTPTSGQNAVPILRVNSKDVNITQEEVFLAYAQTDGIATNDKEAPVYTQFIPWKAANPAKSLDNAEIDFTLSVNVSSTGGFDVAVGVVYSLELPDMEFLIELMTGLHGRATGGAKAEQDAGISAITATAFTTGIKVTSVAKNLIGIMGYVNPNAPTAGEAAVGIMELTASQMTDFQPQEWVFGLAWDASLGTPVGTPVSASRRNGFYQPTRFDLPETNFTMGVSMKVATVLSNPADGVAAVVWKND